MNEDFTHRQEKPISDNTDMEAEIYDLKERYSYLRKVISTLKKNEKKNRKNLKKEEIRVKEE